MARDDDSSRSGCENLPQTPDSPTSAGFNSDQLPFNTIQNYTDDDDEASVDPEIIRDEPDDVVNEEEDEGEDLFNNNFMELNCPEAAMRSLQLARQHASSEPERLVYEGWLYDTGHCEEGLRKAGESINLQRSFEAFFLKAYALADSSQDPSCSSTVVSLLEEALKCPLDRLRKGQALVQFSNSETASDAKDALDGRSIPRYLIPELGPCSLSIAYSAHTDLSVKFPSHRSRDYTNPLLTVAPSAIDASGQFSLGVDGKKLEPESNVLLASIENMQYSVTLDVLHTVFSSFGPVLKIAMFDKNGGLQALIQYPDGCLVLHAVDAIQKACKSRIICPESRLLSRIITLLLHPKSISAGFIKSRCTTIWRC